jgi:acyl-CoA thioesterase FadM
MERWVEARDVDQIGIIDNTVFGAYAEEAATRALAAVGWPPGELAAQELLVQPRRFHILHQTPAVWGDRLRLSVYLRALEDTGGEWAIAVERSEDGAAIATCTLRWALVDRATGKPQPLPESLSAKLQERVAFAD